MVGSLVLFSCREHRALIVHSGLSAGVHSADCRGSTQRRSGFRRGAAEFGQLEGFAGTAAAGLAVRAPEFGDPGRGDGDPRAKVLVVGCVDVFKVRLVAVRGKLCTVPVPLLFSDGSALLRTVTPVVVRTGEPDERGQRTRSQKWLLPETRWTSTW